MLDAVARLPRWYSAAASGPLRVLELRSNDLIDVLEDHFDMAMEFLAVVSGALLESFEDRAAVNSRITR